MKNKIFVISLPKSGTTSTSFFLESLGLSAIHWVGNNVDLNQIPLGDKDVFLNLTKSYDVSSDAPYYTLFKELDEMYNNAKFLLINREINAWALSSLKHRKREYGNFKTEKTAVTFLENNYFKKNFEEFSFDGLKENYYFHQENVLNYFNKKNNFMQISLHDENIENKICNFLNIENINNQKFPHLNKRPR